MTTLVFMQMPGSDDDVANLQASQLIKSRGYTTYLPAVNAYSKDAFIASGAVDMILAGVKRIIDVGAEVGVHAWSGDTNDATDFPVGHPAHLPYINYYVSMGYSQADAEAFYYFTINAAPSNGTHNMTEAELEQYKLRTCTYNVNPTYTTSLDGNTITVDLPGATYQWLDCNNGNAPISGETAQSFIANAIGDYAVQITENNCTNTLSCVSVAILPVTLISLEAYPTKENEIILDWETGSESNNKGFEIQRKNDLDEIFTTIGWENGQDNSNIISYYSFIDKVVKEGDNYYYRLNQIDHDGKNNYSNIVSSRLSENEFTSFSVYPNPTKNKIIVSFSDETNRTQKIQLFSSAGQFIKEVEGDIRNSALIEIDLSQFENGMYFIQVGENRLPVLFQK